MLKPRTRSVAASIQAFSGSTTVCASPLHRSLAAGGGAVFCDLLHGEEHSAATVHGGCKATLALFALNHERKRTGVGRVTTACGEGPYK